MIDDNWKCWIAEHKLLNMREKPIVGIMAQCGFSESEIIKEIETVNNNPYIQA